MYGEFGGLAPGEQFEWYDSEINKTDRFVKMIEIEFDSGTALNAVRLRDGRPAWFPPGTEVVACDGSEND